jgi:hypothetical protein
MSIAASSAIGRSIANELARLGVVGLNMGLPANRAQRSDAFSALPYNDPEILPQFEREVSSPATDMRTPTRSAHDVW